MSQRSNGFSLFPEACEKSKRGGEVGEGNVKRLAHSKVIAGSWGKLAWGMNLNGLASFGFQNRTPAQRWREAASKLKGTERGRGKLVVKERLWNNGVCPFWQWSLCRFLFFLLHVTFQVIWGQLTVR